LGSQAGRTSRWPVVLLFSQLVFRLLLPHLPRIKGRRRMRGLLVRRMCLLHRCSLRRCLLPLHRGLSFLHLGAWEALLALVPWFSLILVCSLRVLLMSLMSMHASILVDSVGPPSAEVCRTTASFP
jgi:hypothetical protein